MREADKKKLMSVAFYVIVFSQLFTFNRNKEQLTEGISRLIPKAFPASRFLDCKTSGSPEEEQLEDRERERVRVRVTVWEEL